ncbi:MAG: hypothetical protein ACREBZ_02460 [Thermoplasmata archaeon]
MVNLALWLGIGIGVVAIVVVIALLWVITRRVNRRTGDQGPVHRSRLTCPKCGKTFDYDWVVGAALTAVRLGKNRYMACPLCHHWSMFNIYDTVIPKPSSPPS